MNITIASEHGLVIRGSAQVASAISLSLGTGGLLLTEDDVGQEFFRLESGIAGELLQKLVNYRIKTTFVCSDPSAHGTRFSELAYEHSTHPQVRFFPTAREAIDWLELKEDPVFNVTAGADFGLGLVQGLFVMAPDEALVAHLEHELLEGATRINTVRMAELLADDFLEFGASGVSYGKAEVMSLLPSESGRSFRVGTMQARTLSPSVILLAYAVENIDAGQTLRSLRSSVWVNRAGRWRLQFHQGSAAA